MFVDIDLLTLKIFEYTGNINVNYVHYGIKLGGSGSH
jgi:hypothetical protein